MAFDASLPRVRWAAIALAGALFAAILALRYGSSGDDDATLVLFVVPVAICAMTFGLVGGLAAAAVACLLLAIAGLTGLLSLHLIGYISRGTPYLVIGILLGRFVDRQRELLSRATNAEMLARDLIATIGADGYFKRVNPAWGPTLGYSASELLSRPCNEFVHPDDRDRTREAAAQLLDMGEEIVGFRNRYRAKDGSFRLLEWNARGDAAEGLIYCTARDVTKREEAEREMAAARESAERANMAKSEFLSRMSHELRTPLNAILGFGQLLQMGELDRGQRESVDQILRGGRHLLSLIDEILDISRIESRTMSLSLEPIDLADALGDAVELIRPLAAERGISLVTDLGEERRIQVLADTRRLRQVLLNLLSNAVKYNREQGDIRVSSRIVELEGERSEQRVLISIADTGLGIAEADLERLFVPFERMGAEQSGVEGTGLGLPLTEGLVDAMEGRLGVESVHGEGTTFTVELRRAEEVRVADTVSTAQRARQAGQGLPAGCTLLYIDDNVSNLRLVEQILADQTQVRLITAMQARLGLELAEQHDPDLILLDLHLPDIPGERVLKMIKGEPRTRDTPVVILSADATNGKIDHLLRAGASDYLIKPLEVARFLEVVQALLIAR